MKLTTAIALLLVNVSFAHAWENDNDPNNFDFNYVRTFSRLPSQGELTLEKLPWASSYWPHFFGGIAFRWNQDYSQAPVFANTHLEVWTVREEIEALEAQIFAESTSPQERLRLKAQVDRLNARKEALERSNAVHYQRAFFSTPRNFSAASLRAMSQEQIAGLSPAEKFDLYVGDYDMSLTKHVLDLTSPNDEYWEGICNGWSSAALEFHEPLPVTVTNPQGIRIPFGSSDLKALLSFYHSALTNNAFARRKTVVNRIGQVCRTAYTKSSWFIRGGVEYYKSVGADGRLVVRELPVECRDTNPAAFHIAMANDLGLKDVGFVAEVVVDAEIWNQPVYKFTTEILEEADGKTLFPTSGSVAKQVKVKTELFYANDGGDFFWGEQEPNEQFFAWWEATNGTKDYRSESKVFEYVLDLDASGKIINGHWLTYERPDFIWIKRTKGFIGDRMRFGIAGNLDALKNIPGVRVR